MNKQFKLEFGKRRLETLAKENFIDMSKDESLWDKANDIVKECLDPVCIYSVYSDLSVEDNILHIGDEFTLKSAVFSSIPKEILGQCGVFVMSVGDGSKCEGILDEGLEHMVRIAYLDALKDLLRQEFEGDYLVGSYFAPGLGDMKVEEIQTIAKMVDFEQAGVTINDSYMMEPVKSVAGLFMFFNEVHPESQNACTYCINGGDSSCNLCSAGNKEK